MPGRFILWLAGVAISMLMGSAAHAALLIQIDKSAQRMSVTLNGDLLYTWPVSTGNEKYDTPSGTFTPFRMEIDHRSDDPRPDGAYARPTAISSKSSRPSRQG